MTGDDAAARILGHPVSAALPPDPAGRVAVASLAGDPPRARVAWLDPAGGVRARVACPPGIPSAVRPVVAAEVTLDPPGGPADRVLVAVSYTHLTLPTKRIV